MTNWLANTVLVLHALIVLFIVGGVNGGRNPPLNGGGSFPGTIFEQRAGQKSRSGIEGKGSLAKRIFDAAKGQKTGPGCDLGRAHKSAFSQPFNGGFASPLTSCSEPR